MTAVAKVLDGLSVLVDQGVDIAVALRRRRPGTWRPASKVRAGTAHEAPARHDEAPTRPRGRTGRTPAEAAALRAAGYRSVADLIAPEAVRVLPDRVVIHADGRETHLRVLVAAGMPRSVTPGWLYHLVTLDVPLDVSLHVQPLDADATITTLSYRLWALEAKRNLDLSRNRPPDPEANLVIPDLEDHLHRLQERTQNTFSLGLYVAVRAGDKDELDRATRRVEAELRALQVRVRRATLDHLDGWHACLPEGLDALRLRHDADTSSLAFSFPLVTKSLSMDRGVLFGTTHHTRTPVLLAPFDRSLKDANVIICASIGGGKSYCVKLLVLRSLTEAVPVDGFEPEPVEAIIIDPEGEYDRVCEAVGGQVIEPSGTSPHRLNPFDLPSPSEDEAEPKNPVIEQAIVLLSLLGLMLPAQQDGALTAEERAVLERALYATYRRAGIDRDDPATHTTDPARMPVMADLRAVLDDAAAAGASAPADRETARALLGRLTPYLEGGTKAGLFRGRTNVDLGARLVVFSLAALSKDLWPVGIHVATDDVWRRQRRRRRPRLLVVDEAASVLRSPSGSEFLATMAERARKHWLGLVTCVQRVENLTATDNGRAVLNNASIKVLLNQEAGENLDQAAHAFVLTEEERAYLLAAQQGEALLIVRNDRAAIRIVASPEEHELATTQPAEVRAITRRRRQERAARTRSAQAGASVPDRGEAAG